MPHNVFTCMQFVVYDEFNRNSHNWFSVIVRGHVLPQYLEIVGHICPKPMLIPNPVLVTQVAH